MHRREMLQRQIERAEAELARLDNLLPLGDLDNGAVITFQKVFPETPGRVYNYAAVKNNGKWWMTGTTHKSNIARDDVTMAEFIAEGWPVNAEPQQVWYATEWEEVL